MKPSTTLFLLPALALAAPTPDTNSVPSSIKVGAITYGGSGCPQGTLDIAASPDGSVIPLRFGNAFQASIGPSVDVDQNRKNCQVNFDLQFSPGFQYTVVGAEYQGYGQLQQGVKGMVRANYYFSSQQNQATTSSYFSGPFSSAYDKHDDVGIATWSPCGSEAMLNINSEVALTSSDAQATGSLTSDKQINRFIHQVYLKWRQC